MGCIGSCSKPKVSIKESVETPSIYLEENFKLIDYTGQIKSMKSFSEIRNVIGIYKLNDIRCVKRINETEEVHSSLIAISNSLVSEELW
jgi:hypothetical protein